MEDEIFFKMQSTGGGKSIATCDSLRQMLAEGVALEADAAAVVERWDIQNPDRPIAVVVEELHEALADETLAQRFRELIRAGRDPRMVIASARPVWQVANPEDLERSLTPDARINMDDPSK